ncbi:MAG: hypothetical protein ACE5HB_11270, partial [Terriglobia bacterium]
KVRLISNAVKAAALPLQVTGKGGLDNVDLERVVSVLVSRKTRFDTLEVRWLCEADLADLPGYRESFANVNTPEDLAAYEP